MGMFEWTTQFATGYLLIDNQHKKIFTVLQEFVDILNERKGDKALYDKMKEIEKAIVSHFDSEERLMAQYNYPEADSHLKEHNILGRNLNIIKKAVHAQGVSPKLLLVINMTFKKWKIDHINDYDKPLCTFLALKGVGKLQNQHVI